MVSEESGENDVSGNTREQGIEFGALKERLSQHDYPTRGAELIEAYGHFELQLPGGETTFGEVLGKRRNEDGTDEDIQYDSAEDVHVAIHNMVGSDAVGREDYTDRGGSARGSEGERDEQDSF